MSDVDEFLDISSKLDSLLSKKGYHTHNFDNYYGFMVNEIENSKELKAGYQLRNLEEKNHIIVFNYKITDCTKLVINILLCKNKLSCDKDEVKDYYPLSDKIIPKQQLKGDL